MVPALGVAQTLQNRVGTTFSSLQLLPGPEQSAALVGAGATSIGTAVLTSIKEGQDKILEATNQVVSLIQTQVDIAEEQERRARDNLTELNKERPVQGPPVPIDVGSDKGKFKLDKEGFLGDLDVGDMAAIATAGSLLLSSVAKKVVKGGAKGGFYGILASFLAKPAIDFLEEGRYIITDQLEDLNGNTTAEIGDIVYTTENQKPFDNYFGVNLYHVINEDTQKQIIVSEDNVERIRF